jgi:HK97 family phage prohead protease
MNKYVDHDRFRELARRGDTGGAPVAHLGSVARAAEDGSRVVTFVFSDGTIDRMGDKIDPYGWELSGFRANPVCLFAHDASSPPIGKVRRTYVSGDRLMGEIQFASADVYPFADQIYKLIVNGFIRACSVGFTPIEWEWAESKERPMGIDFKRQELLEISVVPIPANANALIEAQAKSLARRHSSAPVERRTPSTLDFGGTYEQRQSQLRYAHPEIEPNAAQRERDAAISAADPATREGRVEIAAAHRRFGERLKRR